MNRPLLIEPFPREMPLWTCPKTGLVVPKTEDENLSFRKNLLERAAKDRGLQSDLLAACSKSFLFFVNVFCFTYHQFEVLPSGERVESTKPHRPFITWEIQDVLCDEFELSLKNAEDILIDKSRDLGASWIAVAFLFWLWLFRPDSQMLMMSRVQDYVDQTGNMKALFQKLDYMNERLPSWMRPPDSLPGQKYRTKMHVMNVLNRSVIDGESTTQHAARGDRRLVILLDEFGAVEAGKDTEMRTATRDAALMRIINSTVGPAGCEYNRWKNSKQIKVFVLPFYEHPEKGCGRYVKDLGDGKFEIRSPWLDHEITIRSKQEIDREILRKDVQAGSNFFDERDVDKHIERYASNPTGKYDITFQYGMAQEDIAIQIRSKNLTRVKFVSSANGPLRVWTRLLPYEINGTADVIDRPDQSKSYIIGIDPGKGQGASNSVLSVKCRETGEKIAEWKSAIYPPYDLAPRVVALALWVGGREPTRLPKLVWENNGPGWDLGRLIVKKYLYPFYYCSVQMGKVTERKSDSYGWHSGRQQKYELLSEYARVLAHGGFINHSLEGLEEAKIYIHFDDGSIGPAYLVNESPSARKTHGDIVMADALTLVEKIVPRQSIEEDEKSIPVNSSGYRLRKVQRERKSLNSRTNSYRKSFNFEISG